jgi:hypothetical protein
LIQHPCLSISFDLQFYPQNSGVPHPCFVLHSGQKYPSTRALPISCSACNYNHHSPGNFRDLTFPSVVAEEASTITRSHRPNQPQVATNWSRLLLTNCATVPNFNYGVGSRGGSRIGSRRAMHKLPYTPLPIGQLDLDPLAVGPECISKASMCVPSVQRLGCLDCCVASFARHA